MGFLHKLWDDTVAGPAPESGLGKLRKYDSLSPSSRSSHSNPHDHLSQIHDLPVSRRITIVRSNSLGTSSSPPSSPTTTDSSTPTSPFSPATSPRAGDFTFNHRKKKDRLSAFQRPPDDDIISPTVYDWIVINALDR